MNRLSAFTIAIRAINQKMGTVKRRKVRLALEEARSFLANDEAFEWERERLALNPHAELHPEYQEDRRNRLARRAINNKEDANER
jgi:hypothetical protein